MRKSNFWMYDSPAKHKGSDCTHRLCLVVPSWNFWTSSTAPKPWPPAQSCTALVRKDTCQTVRSVPTRRLTIARNSADCCHCTDFLTCSSVRLADANVMISMISALWKRQFQRPATHSTRGQVHLSILSSTPSLSLSWSSTPSWRQQKPRSAMFPQNVGRIVWNRWNSGISTNIEDWKTCAANVKHCETMFRASHPSPSKSEARPEIQTAVRPQGDWTKLVLENPWKQCEIMWNLEKGLQMELEGSAWWLWLLWLSWLGNWKKEVRRCEANGWPS